MIIFFENVFNAALKDIYSFNLCTVSDAFVLFHVNLQPPSETDSDSDAEAGPHFLLFLSTSQCKILMT